MPLNLGRFGIASADEPADATPVRLVAAQDADAILADLEEPARYFLELNGFSGEAGRFLVAPGQAGGPPQAVLGTGDGADPFILAAVAEKAPDGVYALHGAAALDPAAASRAAFAWGLGRYRFTRYKDGPTARPQFVAPPEADLPAVARALEATFLARDLVNTPTEDMGPDALAAEAEMLAERFSARFSVVEGDALLTENYPLVHAVGRAAAKAPRLITLDWGRAEDPRLAIIGKGVCFDSGGLNIKPEGGMGLMKKDMGGAANALALAQMVMAAGLRVRLTLLIPAVENAVSGSSFRPSDVFQSRAGKTVEILNTDAEGRLVLADAMARAAEAKPDLTITLATLTGAARVALGPELPPFYTDDEGLAAEIAEASIAAADPVWRMPLWAGYDGWLDSDIADMANISTPPPFAGSITAALFLKRFAPETGSYVHFDIYAWSLKKRPGRPVGGEAQAVRALFGVLANRYPPAE
ncbi:MAG: leucyl aminopeptidase family protein [Pseudomonadota bacterium]